MNRLHVIVASILGSLLIYCGQQAATSLGDGGGPVGDARAQGSGTCCAPSFVKIAEGKLTTADMNSQSSAELDLSPYHQVVLYVPYNNCDSVLSLSFIPTASGQTDFATTVKLTAGVPAQVIGPRGRLYFKGDRQYVHGVQVPAPGVELTRRGRWAEKRQQVIGAGRVVLRELA